MGEVKANIIKPTFEFLSDRNGVLSENQSKTLPILIANKRNRSLETG
jgi:hypothetical protein